MAAACDDRRDIVKALLDVGADKDAENEVLALLQYTCIEYEMF
jgi:hypothetical protein